MRLAVLLTLLLVHVAHADVVNLLASSPTTVAVSSTVDNAAIVPEHLVDGKLDTAWNSRTGDLQHAWVAFRVTRDAHVSTIKLTAGYAKRDKQGDLFTMNQRIKRVRVLRDGVQLAVHTLDVERRDLQDIAIDADGGDFTIEVVELVAGSKASWQEVAISELEVWGTVAKVVPSRPTVRVGSLDVDCAKLLFPGLKANRIAADDLVLDTGATILSSELAACTVRHGNRGTPETNVEIALVKLGTRPSIVSQLPAVEVTNGPSIADRAFADTHGTAVDSQAGGMSADRVTSEMFALSATEHALVVRHIERTDGPMEADELTTSTLYRVTTTSLTPVLEFKSSIHHGEADDSDVCELALGKARKPLPDLDLKCTVSEGRWHNEDPRGNGTFETHRTEHYRWTSTRSPTRL
jgi:hypothetical protein